ncbi:cytidine deaminase family protein [Eubacterium sp.]
MMKHKFNSRLIQDEQIENLYDMAKSVAIPKVINEQMSSGGVGAAILTKQGNIYTGVCIDTDCSLGMCAERNALSTMITNGEYEVEMIIAVTKVGKVIPPCGACREFMWQLKNSRDIKVVLDNEETVVNLEDLMPYPY